MITQLLRNASLGLIFLTTFIPLYVENSFFFPFITGKGFAFRILVEIAFALWLLLMLRDKKYAPRFSWISVAVTAFAVVTLIADMAGLNPIRSIWSNFERMEGWLMILHLWMYFMAAAGIFGSGEEGRRMWHNLFRSSLIAASIVGIYGIFQLFGWAAVHQGSTRIDASLGNAAYMAVYMLMHTFLAWYLGLVAHERRDKKAVWGYLILGVVFAYLLFETATRGTILGLAGGLLLAFALYGIFGKGESKKGRLISLAGIALIVVFGIGIVLAKDTAFIKNNEALNRLATISWSESKTQARGYVWPMAVKGVFENPKTAILGVGQENFNYIFNKNYNPEMWRHEQWFDRAHSVFLDWLVAGGLLGFVLYLSLFVISLASLWKSQLSFKEKCLLTGLLVGYAIHNVFVFDNIASYVLFFTVLGFVHTLSARNAYRWLERRDIETENSVVIRDYVYMPIIVLGLIASLYFLNIKPIQSNTRLITAMTGCFGGGVPSSEHFLDALKLNQPIANQEIREQLISCTGSVANGSLTLEEKNKFYNLTLQEIDKQMKATPNDARIYVIAGSFFNALNDWQNAAKLLEKANELSPNKQSIILELAVSYMNQGKTAESLKLLEETYTAAPDNHTAKLGYISALIIAGQSDKAEALLKDSPDLYDTRLVNAYVISKQYNKAAAIMNVLISKDPGNMQNYISLASVYFQAGNKTQALAVLRDMKTKFPQATAQIDATIAEVEKSL